MAAYGTIDERIQLVNRSRLPGSHGRRCVICRLQCKLKALLRGRCGRRLRGTRAVVYRAGALVGKRVHAEGAARADVDRLQRVIILRLGACTVRGRGAEVDIKLGALWGGRLGRKGGLRYNRRHRGHIGRLLHRLLLDGRGLLLREAAGVRNDIVHRVVRAVCGIG